MVSKVSKTISKIFSKLVWLVSIFIIILVFLISLLKVSLPYWVQQEEEITDFIESYIGGELSFDKLQVDWSGFKPIANIDNLQWSHPEKKITFQSSSNQLKIDLWRTLYNGYLVTDNLVIDNAKLDLAAISGSDSSFELSLPKVKQFLEVNSEVFNHQHIKVNNLAVLLKKSEQSYQQHFPVIQIKQIKNQKQLIVESYGELLERGRFVLESEGELSSENNHINIFSDFRQFNLVALSELTSIKELKDFNRVNLKSWWTIQGNILEKGRLEITNEQDQIARVDLKLNFLQQANALEIISDEFLISLKQEEKFKLHESFVYLKEQSDKEAATYHIATGVIPLRFIRHLATLFFEPTINEQLTKLNPTGLLENSNIRLAMVQNSWIPLDGTVHFSNLNVQSYQNVPSISLHTLMATGVNGDWWFEAKSQNSSLNWQPMFKEEIAIDKLYLAGRYSFNQDTELLIDQLIFDNSDAKIKARARLAIQDPLSMAIYAEVEKVRIGKLYRYWPRDPGFSEQALHYLDESLLGGTVDFAKFIWQGEPTIFPFLGSEGQFDIQAKVSNAVFKFEEDWPAARQLNAHAVFANESITINATKADLLGAKVKSAQAIIPDLTQDDPHLIVEVDADSNYASYFNVYNQSPLKEMFGNELVNIKFDKSLALKLKLDLLLAKEAKAKVDGLINFKANQINGIPYRVALEQMQGQLVFTEKGAYSKDLKAKLMDGLLNIDLKVDEYTDNESLVKIDANGLLDIAKISKQLLQFNPLYTEGKSHFNIHYEIDDNETANESLIISSDLVGTSIKGPDWLAKTKQKSAPLLATVMKLGNDVRLRTSYSDQAASQLMFNVNSPEKLKGIIKLGSLATQPLKIPTSGVSIDGYFDKILVKEWLEHIEIPKSKTNDWPTWIEHINITTPELLVAGQTFNKVRINDERTNDQNMQLNFYSEQAKAKVAFYKDGLKKVSIEQLDITLKPWQQVSRNQVSLDLSQYDNWQFECQLCQINGYSFGPITLSSQYQDDKIVLAGSAYVSDQLLSKISGSITDNNTNLQVDFSVPNPNGLLKLWDLDGEIRDTQTTGVLNLNWPGSIHDFSLSQTYGSFSLETEKGAIKDLSDRKARIFSLFSLQSIPRRLSLDFSDLFRDGFFYDKIIGKFKIDKGQLISEQVEIEGTAADVSVSGVVDLNTQQVDQKVVVTPKLGSSLPVLAGWAIEPTTGLIMLIVSKIFEPALNVVSSIEYKITGNLEDPVVEEVAKQSKEVQVSEELINQEKEKNDLDTQQESKPQEEQKP